MTTLETMYAPQVNSPATSLSSNISSSATSISVANGSVLPAAPMLLVIGGDTENAETVLMTAKSSNTLTVTRGVEGTARSWTSGATVARLFTAKDLSVLQSNVTALNSGKAETGDVPTASTSTPQMDGSGSYGSGTTYARGNHVHPTDTTRQAKITASGILKGDGSGGVTAATGGTDYALPSSVPTASTTNPSMDGTASYGSGTSYARSNHTHPTDTSRQAKITASGILKGDGNGGVAAAVAGTDYQTPLAAGTDYATPAAVAACIPSSEKGANSGVASLDSYGKVNAAQTSARIVSKSAAYTLQSSDAGCLLTVTGTTTITIPSTLPLGTEIEIMNYGTGTITVAAASGVTLNGTSAGSKTITDQYTSAVLKAITATAWVIQGAIS